MLKADAVASPDGATERPVPSPDSGQRFGSDLLAETLRALDIPYVALNPAASFRGLHDSLVNHLGNTLPQLLLCLHEEHAVAIAHGWAKVTGKPMAAALHSNVGLMHGTMAIFNAWCDRMPVIVLGATGPVDAVKRRPWIDWIHTARDQADRVRDVPAMACALRRAVGDRPISLTHLPLSWRGESWHFRHPLDFLGSDGGGGIGGGPGISVGAALALRGSGRLPVAICGDGDFLMGVTALWTAAHDRIPLLVLVADNRSFFNDEVHQEWMACLRGRPIENKWIGQRISDPDIDLAGLARAQGASGFDPASDGRALDEALAQAIDVVDDDGVAVIDARVLPGYTPAMAAALSRDEDRKA